MLAGGSVNNNSTANTALGEGSTSCVPGTTSTTATIHGVDIIVKEFKLEVTGDICSCRSGFQLFFSDKILF